MKNKNVRALVAGFIFASIGVALAVTIPNSFVSGTVISSGKINENFTNLKTSVDLLEAKTIDMVPDSGGANFASGVLTAQTVLTKVLSVGQSPGATLPTATVNGELRIGNVNQSGSLRFDDELGQKITLFGDPTLDNDSYGIGIQGARMYFRIPDKVDHFYSWYFGGSHNGGNVLPAMFLDRTGNLNISGTLVAGSDRNIKRNIQTVNTREMLKKVLSLPIQKWEYKADPKGLRHVGPMAQDFSKAFSLGKNDKTIATVDADGVALAAIQGLNQVVLEKDAKIQSLEKRVSQLESLEARLAKLEAARR
jgi:hypothetical protein